MTNSLTIDVRLKTVGRFKKRCGTADLATRDEIVAMLQTLDGRGRGDLLVALKRGDLRPLPLLETYRQRGLKGLPSVEHCKPLADAMTSWLRKADIGKLTRRDYRFAFDTLIAVAGEGATLASLPAALEKYRERANGKTTFNRVRAAARSFAGKHTDLWATLSKIKPFKERRARARTLSPDAAREASAKLGQLGGMFWTMCCTGMSGGPHGPYFRDLYEIHPDHVHIHGTKTEGRERIVPRLTTPTRKLVEYAAFRRAMKAIGLKPNDGRHTFQHWAQMTVKEDTRVRRYMGHGPKDLTQAYGFDFDQRQYVKEDGAKLKAFVGKDWAPAMELSA